MSVIEWSIDEKIAIITMNNGENRMNLEFTGGMLTTFDEIEKEESASAVVITSSDQKNWSQGIDLDWMVARVGEGDFGTVKKFIYSLNDVYKRILLFPTPVIAAINGHAAAGGAILSCVCDFRFMRADRGFFLFPEINIEIPFYPGMLAFTKRAFPYHKFEEAMLTGNRYTATELEEFNVIRKACEDREAVLTEAIAFAKTFNKKRGIFGEMKKRMNREIIDVIDNVDPIYIEQSKMSTT